MKTTITTANASRPNAAAVAALKKRDYNDLNYFVDALRAFQGLEPLHHGRYGGENGANTEENKAMKDRVA